MALTKVSTDGVKDDAITSGKIPANAVGASELADNAVDTNAIANNAVTAGKTSGVQTTINNNADNRVITGSGTANTLNGESNVNIDSSGRLLVGTSSASGADSGADDLVIGNTSQGNNGMSIVTNAANNGVLFFADQDGTVRGGIRYQHGADLAQFYAGGNVVLNLKNKGVGINESSPAADALTIRGGDTDDTPRLILKRATDAIQVDGEIIGKLQFMSNENNVDSGNYQPRAEIHGVTVSTSGAAKMDFYTVPNSTTTPVKSMIIDQTGKVSVLRHGLNLENSTATSSRAFSITNASGTTGWTFGNGVLSSSHQFVIYDNSAGAGRMLIDSNGIARFNNGIQLGNGLTNSTAHQLDDYEKGTWTPVLKFSNQTTSFTVSVAQGSYQKIGDLVYCKFVYELNGGSAGVSGTWEFHGLPYTVSNDLASTGQEGFGQLTYWNSVNSASNYIFWVQDGGTAFNLMKVDGSGSGTTGNATSSDVNSSTAVRGSIVYMAS
jgi:hypothetical protein|tara:strand:+ start:81 stop:1565 length:1485 start_codon:yes stop_codon:yes gene_type:complete